jgi:hypothetical protein
MRRCVALLVVGVVACVRPCCRVTDDGASERHAAGVPGDDGLPRQFGVRWRQPFDG